MKALELTRTTAQNLSGEERLAVKKLLRFSIVSDILRDTRENYLRQPEPDT